MMAHRRPLKGSTPTRRRGFSLLEVMLSLTLSVMLLTAIFSAMNQSWRLTASGREEMARSQLARALLRKISLDVRAVMFVPPPPSDEDADSTPSSTGSSASTSGSATSSSSSTKSSTSSTAASTSSTATATAATAAGTATATDSATATEPSATSIGIRGTATQIELHISRARRDLNFATNVDGNNIVTRTSDLLAVTYSLALAGGGSTVGTGLIRSEGDRLIVQTIEEKGGGAAMASKSQALAPEVSALAFRYFDGTHWQTVWDSVSNGYLPRAVEVSIAFTPPKNAGGPLANVTVSSSTNQFRTVILVPVSDPLPPELVP